jgi:hypothetical protein
MAQWKNFKARGMAICRCKTNPEAYHKFLARTLIECDATGFDDWQEDGGFWHNEGQLNIDWSTAKAVYPDEYEIIFGDKNITGKDKISNILEVYTDTVLEDDWEFIEVE